MTTDQAVARQASHENLVRELTEALKQLLHECKEAGFDRNSGYNWPKSLHDAETALARANA